MRASARRLWLAVYVGSLLACSTVSSLEEG
jgi:hypothetical protein